MGKKKSSSDCVISRQLRSQQEAKQDCRQENQSRTGRRWMCETENPDDLFSSSVVASCHSLVIVLMCHICFLFLFFLNFLPHQRRLLSVFSIISPFPCNTTDCPNSFNPCICNYFNNAWLNPCRTNSFLSLLSTWEKKRRKFVLTETSLKTRIIINQQVTHISTK